MTVCSIRYGDEERTVSFPGDVAVRIVTPSALASAADPLGVVASALDDPVGSAPLSERARGARHVTIVVPDATRPAAADVYLLPIIARLSRAGLGPDRMRVVVARGIHTAMPPAIVDRLVGADVRGALYTVQSAPESPELNESIGVDPEFGAVRVHRLAATADLVILTGSITPHHLAGFGGGAKALVPGVAERDTVLAAHRLTLRAVVRPDGSVRSLAGSMGPNPFREALLRTARRFDRCFLLNVVLGDDGGIAAAEAGEVGEAHAAAAARWQALRAPPAPEPVDLVVAGGGSPRDVDLIQAHKALVAAARWARPGAPILWFARASAGPGHPRFLPWFQISKLTNHLAALRREFHPYGLTAYSVRRIAKTHPVYVVSDVSPDLLRPMGLLPFPDAASALDHAVRHHRVRTCAVLP